MVIQSSSILSVVSTLIIIYSSFSAKGQTFLEQPSSLLIPVNRIGVFSCRAHCAARSCDWYWIINNESRSNQAVQQQKGFSSQISQNTSTKEYILTLTVNASTSVNNTNIQCQYSLGGDNDPVGDWRSRLATLLVVSVLPLPHNPTLTNNATHLELLWSPPFLWPGYRIQYYNITFTNKSDGSIAHYRVNSSHYSNQIVSFTMKLVPQCIPTDFTFTISAVTISGNLLPAFNTSDWTPQVGFCSSDISTSVLFKANGEPAVVEVNVQIPEALCSCCLQELNYSLIVKNIQNIVVTDFGPFLHLNSCHIRKLIDPDLKENEMYTVTVIVTKQSQNTSYKHSFNTSFIDHGSKTCNVKQDTRSLFSYQLVVIISLSMAVLVLFSALIILLLCVCINRRRREKEKRVNEAKNKLCKTMVHNPLYDRSGPEYEIVPPRMNASTPPARDVFNTTLPVNQHYDTIHTPGFSSRQNASTLDTAHYVDPPVHSSTRSSKFRSASFSSSAHIRGPSMPERGVAYDVVSRSTTSSVQGSGLMGLKKNGQERNKLHLTLSLQGKNDSIDVTPGPRSEGFVQCKHGVLASDTNDNYTILNPIASQRNVGCNNLRITRLENSVLYSD